MVTINWIIIYLLAGITTSAFLTISLPPRTKWGVVELAITTVILWPIYVVIFSIAAIYTRIKKVTRASEGMPYGLYNRMDFGQYEGEYVQDVIRLDPGYITWCLKNVKGFKLTRETEERYEEAD
jgi:hypothetical protein